MRTNLLVANRLPFPCGGSSRRHVVAEPFERQFLDGAVGLGCNDRGIEHRLELGIALAQADRAAPAEDAALVEAWAGV